MKIKQNNQKGFTIIEVLIVLAIAGLIMLIVFLAVPALQRNSRNTQRKNDVASIQGAISEYNSNNAGKVPVATSAFSGNVKLGFYDMSSNVSVICGQAVSAAQSSSGAACAAGTIPPDTAAGLSDSEVKIVVGTKCPTGGGVPTTTGASIRNTSAVYRLELSSGLGTYTCVDS